MMLSRSCERHDRRSTRRVAVSPARADDTHPSDLGLMRMADTLGPALRQAQAAASPAGQ
jgi:hypothetical protein